MELQKKFNVILHNEAHDVDTLVIATHGFIKKTQKTPQKEINKAISIRDIYFKNKLNK